MIDLSENRIKLEQLQKLPAIQEINLSLNSIHLIPPMEQNAFNNLEQLNLSYN